jgi:hypothetical protein
MRSPKEPRSACAQIWIWGQQLLKKFSDRSAGKIINWPQLWALAGFHARRLISFATPFAKNRTAARSILLCFGRTRAFTFMLTLYIIPDGAIVG